MNKVYVVGMRCWDYDYLKVDEVRVFRSEKAAEDFLSGEGFVYGKHSNVGSYSWEKPHKDGDGLVIDAEIKELPIEG